MKQNCTFFLFTKWSKKISCIPKWIFAFDKLYRPINFFTVKIISISVLISWRQYDRDTCGLNSLSAWGSKMSRSGTSTDVKSIYCISGFVMLYVVSNTVAHQNSSDWYPDGIPSHSPSKTMLYEELLKLQMDLWFYLSTSKSSTNS